MHNGHPGKVKSCIAGILGCMVLVILLLSAFCVAAEDDHDCIGDDCPVCACLRLCAAILHPLAGGAAIVCTAFLLVWLTQLLPASVRLGCAPATLISKKVRLNR